MPLDAPEAGRHAGLRNLFYSAGREQSAIAAFLARTPDAELHATGTPASPGQQNLPGVEEGDGFFYAKLIKRRN